MHNFGSRDKLISRTDLIDLFVSVAKKTTSEVIFDYFRSCLLCGKSCIKWSLFYGFLSKRWVGTYPSLLGRPSPRPLPPVYGKPKRSLLVVTTRCFGKQRVAYSANHNKVKTTRCFLKQRVAFTPGSNALLRHVRSEMLSPGGGGVDKYEVDTGVRPALQQAGAFGESTGSKNEGSLGESMIFGIQWEKNTKICGVIRWEPKVHKKVGSLGGT